MKEAAILAAARDGNAEALERLLGTCAIEKEDGEGGSPMHEAARGGHVACIKVLVEAGGDVNIRSRGVTPVYTAASNGKAECVEILIGLGASCDESLHFAARVNRSDMIAILVRGGALVDGPVLCASSPLNTAALMGHLESVDVLLGLGAKVGGAGASRGRAPLISAASAGHVGCVESLVAAGADVDSTSHLGATALHAAVEGDHWKCARVLVDAGASLDRADWRRWTPAHYAVDRDSRLALGVLLGAGCAVNSVDAEGRTPLLQAVERGRLHCVKLLAAPCYGAHLALSSHVGRTPLATAVTSMDREMVRALLLAGADPGEVDSEGDSLLHRAVDEHDDAGCLLELLEAGADVLATNTEGLTPFGLAETMARDDAAPLLLAFGSTVPKTPFYPRLLTDALAHAERWEDTLRTGVSGIERHLLNGERAHWDLAVSRRVLDTMLPTTNRVTWTRACTRLVRECTEVAVRAAAQATIEILTDRPHEDRSPRKHLGQYAAVRCIARWGELIAAVDASKRAEAEADDAYRRVVEKAEANVRRIRQAIAADVNKKVFY